MNRPRPVCALAAGLMFFLTAARSQTSLLAPTPTSSISGQFVISFVPASNPYFRRPDAGTNSDYLRLEPALLTVSAERFKSALWSEIGLAAGSPWGGKIFLALHPARSLDEPVYIAAQPFLRNWNYRLEIPDLISRDRCARALSAVLLLEIANRNTPVSGRSAAVPEWLTDGLARQILESEASKVILTAPGKMMDGILQNRLNEKRRGIDPLVHARRVLQNSPALTFEQLSWPSDAQQNGDDGGVYLASAQLFVHNLLAVENAPADLRTFLAQLPAYENWQAAFFDAFHEHFLRPLDVEKWWSLQVVAFGASDPGPLWTPVTSCDRLNAALAVPVNVRAASNALPAYAEITLQSVINDFGPPQQVEILDGRRRDLELVQLRLTPELAAVAEGYGQVLQDFLGERRPHGPRRQLSTDAALKQLDALDLRRQEIEAHLRLAFIPPDMNPSPP
jgi:hypothetical protein